jgi:hypothetical protein
MSSKTFLFSQMPLSFNEIKKRVKNDIPLSILKKMIFFCSFPNKTLWCSNRPSHFEERMILITLYKDLTGIGYNGLQKEISKWVKISLESLQHNVKIVYHELSKWALTILQPEDICYLQRLAKKTNRPKPCENVVLWMDSSDFCKKGKRSVHKKKHQWSHKLKGPGRRWLTICNARGQTQWISSPHQPTDYDGDLTLIYLLTIEKLFLHTTIIVDNHFWKAAPFFKTITLITSVSKAGRPKVVKGKKVINELTLEEQQTNNIIAGVRGKVEGLYLWLGKATFSCSFKAFL